MKKAFLSVLFSILLLPYAFSQDVITTRSGEEIKAKVMEILPTEIKFTTADKADVLQSLPVGNVFMIKYENGKKEIFQEQAAALNEAPALNQAPQASPGFKSAPSQNSAIQYNSADGENLYIKGQQDAKTYYDGYKTAGTMTLVSTVLLVPVGLVTAIATSVSPPSRSNLGYPDAHLFSQPDYARGYTAKAKSTKTGKVWKNFGIGFGVILALNLIVASGQ